MVQIIPQDIPPMARFAMALSPQIGEGFQKGMGQGIQQQQMIDANLQQEQRMRQMNVGALQDSPTLNQFPGLKGTFETQAQLGQPVDLQGLSQLYLKDALLKNMGYQGLMPNGQQQQGQQQQVPGVQSNFDQPSALNVQAKDLMVSPPIENQNERALREAQNQPPIGQKTMEWNSMTPDQRRQMEFVLPEVAQSLRNAAINEAAREQTFREIDDARASQVNSELGNWYEKNNMQDPEFDVPKKILANQTKDMDNVDAQDFIKKRMTDVAREIKSYRNITNKPTFSGMDPSTQDKQDLIKMGQKFDKMGLNEWFRGKLAETFPTDYPVEAIMNPLSKDFEKKLNKVQDRSKTLSNLGLYGGLGTGLLGKVLDNNYSEPDQSTFKNIKDVLREAIPGQQSLYAIRNELGNKNIPPAWVEKAARELQAEGVQLNDRQTQELTNVGQTSAEYMMTEISEWLSSLRGTARRAALWMFE